MSEVRLCKDCRFAKVGTVVRCHHPNNMVQNLVTGGEQDDLTPQTLRTFTTACGHANKIVPCCGPDGAWFEPAQERATV